MMTEKEFERKVGDLAARFECRTHASADNPGKCLARKYSERRMFRLAASVISAAAGAGFLISAKRLAGEGRRAAAICCEGIGAAVLASELLRGIIFRRAK